MTPTEQDKKFFVEHQKFFERLWKPAFGDLVLLWDGDKAEWGKDLWCVIGRYSEDAVDVIRESDGAIGAALIVDCAVLARQRQLQVMLEEMGEIWRQGRIDRLYQSNWVADGLIDKDDWYWASVRPKITAKKRIINYGPTPSIALGRALIEVLDKERLEDMDMWIGEDIEAEIKRQFPNG